MPVTLKMQPAEASAPVPTEKTLDPGEVILPPATVNTITEIATLNDSVANPETGYDGATLVIGAILFYFLIKLAFRLLPWILGIGAVILFMKMSGSA
jgi:hypothetical protein